MDAQPKFGQITDEIIAGISETVKRPPLCTVPVEYEGELALNMSRFIDGLYSRLKTTGNPDGLSQQKIDQVEQM